LLLWVAGALVLEARHPGELWIALEETAMGCGLLIGCGIAFPLEQAYVDYRPEEQSAKNRLVAAVLGLPILIVAYVIMAIASDVLLPGFAAELITYIVLILALALLVPYILQRLVVERGQSTP
jgi:hypothetical protein